MMKAICLLFLFLSASAFSAITTEQKEYLNNFMGPVAHKVQLGTLLNLAGTGAGASLASGKLLVGDAGGLAAERTLSGDITCSNTGVTAIGAGKVTKTMLATGVKGAFMIMAAGEHTTVGGAAAEDVTIVGALGTDTVLAVIRKPGAVARTLDTITPAAGKFTLTFSGDPAADHIVSYIVLRPTT